mmetsp:Transcript_5035/g.16579  ORF Transcript_5035/g.16579 Transcript_5035/m.16579 type:complete len:214 (-) Transcript_5035:34-675(-)
MPALAAGGSSACRARARGTAEGARRHTQRAEAQRRRTDRAAACRARLDARRRRRTRLNRPRRLTARPHYPTAPALRGSGRRGRRRRRSRRRCPQPAASLYRAQRRAVRAPRSRRQRRCSRDIREHSSDTCHSHVPVGSECPSWPCPAATCSRPARCWPLAWAAWRRPDRPKQAGCDALASAPLRPQPPRHGLSAGVLAWIVPYVPHLCSSRDP